MNGKLATPDRLFCGQCGKPVRDTPFCERCGAQVLAAGGGGRDVPTPSRDSTLRSAESASWVPHEAGGRVLPGEPQASIDELMHTQWDQESPAVVGVTDHRGSKRAVQIGVAVLALVLVVGAVIGAIAVLGGSKQQGPSYPAQAGQLLGPVFAQNTTLASTVQALPPGGDAHAARTALASAADATQTAQHTVALLKTPQSQAPFAAQINAALTSEATWLQTATSVLANPASPLLSQLSGLGLDAQAKLHGLAAGLPVTVSAIFPSSNPIVAYASARTAATAARAHAAAARAKTAAALTQFSGQVRGLLTQSTPSFQQLNAFYQQLASAAAGAGTTITLAQAEQQISSIVANRTSLGASAQALAAPTPAAKTVRDDLVAAFAASLRDDTDLASCLNQANDGSEAYIFQSCLDASSADSAAATAAKHTFRTAYNQLRARIGQPPVTLQF